MVKISRKQLTVRMLTGKSSGQEKKVKVEQTTLLRHSAASIAATMATLNASPDAEEPLQPVDAEASERRLADMLFCEDGEFSE